MNNTNLSSISDSNSNSSSNWMDTNRKERKPASVAIIGAGLVGALSAIYFARQGWTVRLYESRLDTRSSDTPIGRSINLAVSARGLKAIESIDPELCRRVVADSIPMKGRMIHLASNATTSTVQEIKEGKAGTENGGAQQHQGESQIYGLFGESINSIDRGKLNASLLTEAEGYDNVTLHFGYKLLSADLELGQLTFGLEQSHSQTGTQTKEKKEDTVDLVVGADGAYSALRTFMMRSQRMEFSQSYIPHAYLELHIPPTPTDAYALDKEHLHIWPRQEFMLIALPNPDRSFTSTLFAPWTLFASLTTDDLILQFFRREFPDATKLIGEAQLLRMWHENPTSPLIQIKCHPYHFRNKAILLGDATHAMVPFYGQGMNCGFEDIRVLARFLEQYRVSPVVSGGLDGLEAALSEYSKERFPDLLTILELAMENYKEMRSKVTQTSYKLRKQLDRILGTLFPKYWIPVYSMVSFRDDIRYSHVKMREAWQARVVSLFVRSLLGSLGLAFVFGLLRIQRVRVALRRLVLRLV